MQKPLEAAGGSIPSFGSGTLGYVNVNNERFGDFHGASGFLLGQVDVAARNPATNVAPVSVRLIPDIGELALEAIDGILLRRSNTALFAALARRPRAGGRAVNASQETEVDPYIPIPSVCVGRECASGVFPEYTFTSSNPEVGSFVKENLASPDPHTTPLQGPDGKPISDEPSTEDPIPSEESGLFCAYNEGKTIVTISAGGLSSSLPVTVQAGSVREPCGTVPLKHHVTAAQSAAAPAPPPPAPAPAPAGPAPASSPPLVPVPPAPAVAPPAPPGRPTVALPAPFCHQHSPRRRSRSCHRRCPRRRVRLPRRGPRRSPRRSRSPNTKRRRRARPSRSPTRRSPTAPPNTSPRRSTSSGSCCSPPSAGASVARRRPRRGRRELHVAPATLSSMRAQRRMAAKRRRPW